MAWLHQLQNSSLQAPFYASQNEASSSNYQGPSSSGPYRDATKREEIEALVVVEPILPKFKVYASVSDITYAPETALKEGILMVNTIKGGLERLELGSKLRQEVWDREVQKCVNFWTFPAKKKLYELCLFLFFPVFKDKDHLEH